MVFLTTREGCSILLPSPTGLLLYAHSSRNESRCPRERGRVCAYYSISPAAKRCALRLPIRERTPKGFLSSRVFPRSAGFPCLPLDDSPFRSCFSAMQKQGKHASAFFYVQRAEAERR